MVESLIALCCLWGLAGRQELCELCRQTVGVYHLALGIARVHTDAIDGDLRTGGIEILELEFPNVSSIHRICPVASELLDIKMVGTHADLLIRVKGDTDVSMLNLRMIPEVAHRLYDLGNASLVVGAKERMAVCHDQVFSDMLQKFREQPRTADDTL